MNIFKVLANGDGSINEANVSAFLGYLLDPSADHSLGSEFLKGFMRCVTEESSDLTDYYDYRVFYEQAAKLDEKKHIVDLVVVKYRTDTGQGKESQLMSFLENTKDIEKIFLIENKVREGSIKSQQLINQLRAFEQTLDASVSEKVCSIYVTPNKLGFEQEFQNFIRLAPKQGAHIFWSSEEKKDSIESILTNILKKEAFGEIDPIDKYALQTIKAFKQFIKAGFRSQAEQEKSRKNDRSYTKYFEDLNEKHHIRDRLEKLQVSFAKNGLKFSAPDFRNKRYPRITLHRNNYIFDVTIASTKPDLVRFGFGVVRLGSLEESREHLSRLAEKVNGGLRIQNNWGMYIRTTEGFEPIPLDEKDKIWKRVERCIQLIDAVDVP